MFEALLAIAELLVYLPDLFTESGTRFGCALAMFLTFAAVIIAVYVWTV